MARIGKYESHVKPNLPLIKSWRADGYTEQQIYTKLGVGHNAFNEYKNNHKELREVLKNSRELLVAKIEDSLFTQALKGNTTAIIFSLKNLRPDKWADKRNDDNDDGKEFMKSLVKWSESFKE